MNKLPVGIQSFEKIREEGYLYIDKTRYVYDLVHSSVPYFLSRPRRFGKSLLISTLKAYWEGKKELFSGLEIEKLEDTWKEYPVFHFDFNGANYQEKGALEHKLDFQLQMYEDHFGLKRKDALLGDRFSRAIRAANEQTGLRCVVLVDEYDKPLLDLVEKPELQEHNKDVFKGFFSTLKSLDAYIQFIFITGVSKFHKISIFSDLNQLTDISLSKKYAEVCGITEEELKNDFCSEVVTLADEQNISVDECLKELKQMYDGYRFHPNAEGVYNPHSLLSAFFAGEMGSYWFETGTPTFLLHRLRESHFDIRKFTDRTIYASEAVLRDYTGDALDPIPLLHQTGYLTIAEYDDKRKRYTLCFPNEEVKYGFFDSLIPVYAPKATVGNGLDIFTLDEYIEDGDLDRINGYADLY